MQKPAITDTPIHDIIAQRWSARAYDVNKPISFSHILSMLEAARWAPSCYGDQPWRFVVCNKQTHTQAWQDAYECLSPGNQTWAINAPLLILICASTLFSHNQTANRWSGYDTGAAAENLSLQATALGLSSHQLGGFDSEKARQLFAVPTQYELMSFICVGYTVSVESLTEDLKPRELSPRSRKPLGELFFNGTWDKPIL